MKTLVLATVALVGLSAAAAAADLPRRAGAPAPYSAVAAPVFSWMGVYAGAHAGWAWNDAEARFSDTTGFGGAAAAGAFPSLALEESGFLIGGHVGGNLQFGAIVAGLEADLSYTHISGTNAYAFPGITGGPGPRTTTVTSDLDFLGTVRGRVGYGFDRFLVYGTGGYAYGGGETTGSVAANFDGGFPTLRGTSDEVALGWAAGVGGEWAFSPNLIFRLEYLHYDLEDQAVTLANSAGDDVTYSIQNTGDLVRGGASFKF